MNPSLTRLALKPLARGADVSRCRSLLAAPMKSTVVGSMDDVSVTRYGGSGFLVGMLTKMMSTAANGKMPVLLEPLKKYEYDHRKHEIDCFMRCRSDMQIREIFDTWIMCFGKVYASAEEKERRYAIFKGKVRFIEERDCYTNSQRLGLDYFSDMTPKEYFAMKDQDQTAQGSSCNSVQWK